MRKENILVVTLVAIALGGIYFFWQKSDAPLPAARDQAASPAVPAALDLSSEISWQDYTPGMARAGKEGKSVLLYFHAPWCTYCTKLKQTTFKDSRVLAYLDKNFISIQVNTDNNQSLAQKWGVKGLPTLWFLEDSGKKISSLPGYVDAGQLLKILEYIHTQSYTTMEFREFVNRG